MPTFLSDPTPTFYLILIAFAVIAGVMAARGQDRKSLATFGAAAAILLLVFLIDKFVESPREESVRRVEEMSQAADTRNPDAFIAHIADKVEFTTASPPVTRTKAEVKASHFWELLRQHNVHVAVWDFSRENVRQPDPNTIEIGFMGKGELRSEGKQFPVYIRATFARQPDGQYRLTKFGTYHPTNHAEPMAVPGFP